MPRRWLVLVVVLLAIPLVPFALVALTTERDPLLLWVESTQARAGETASVCFLLLCSDVFLPVPSSLVAVISGQALGTLGGGLLNLAAISLGHGLGFAVSRRWGRGAAERLVGRDSLARAGETWSWGAALALILSRPVPVLAESLSMFAGLTSFPAGRFAALILVANLPHSFLYSWAGARVHDVETLGTLVAVGVTVPAVAYLLLTLGLRLSRRARVRSGLARDLRRGPP